MEYDLSTILFVVGAVWVFASIAVWATADARGNNGLAWFLGALVFSPLMAVLLLIASPMGAGERVRCPRCAERILAAAAMCPFCRAERDHA